MPRNRYCWDSSVFIALLTGEERPEEEKAGLLEVADLVERGEAIIVTSSLVRAEVLGDSSTPTVRSALDALFRRPQFVSLDVNATIGERAARLRESLRREGRRLASADAIFVATALAFLADALHTFDDRLLHLSGSPLVDALVICKPQGTQTVLAL